MFLLLGHMQQYRGLKLPYRAGKVVPDEVRKLLAETPLALPDNSNGKPKRIGHDKAKQDTSKDASQTTRQRR